MTGPLPLTLTRVALEIDGVRVVSDFTLSIAPGRRTIVIGPNGAGKSLLMRLCHGLIAPTGGSIEWAGDPAGRQAMVFQRPVLLRRSALANVAYGLKLRGVPHALRQRRAAEAEAQRAASEAQRAANEAQRAREALQRAETAEAEVARLRALLAAKSSTNGQN